MKNLNLQEIQSVSGGAASVAAISGAVIGATIGNQLGKAFLYHGMNIGFNTYASAVGPLPFMCVGAFIGQGLAKLMLGDD